MSFIFSVPLAFEDMKILKELAKKNNVNETQMLKILLQKAIEEK